MSENPIHNNGPLPGKNEEDPSCPIITTFLHFHNRFVRRMGEVLGTHGLSLAQFDVLATLWHMEGIAQQELAERLLVTKGNVVGLIDRISSAGWVERRPDPEDRRANLLYLTEAGRKVLTEAMPSQYALGNKIFGTLTKGELRLMRELLERLDRACRNIE